MFPLIITICIDLFNVLSMVREAEMVSKEPVHLETRQTERSQ